MKHETTVVIENSTNINLLKIHIDHSLGRALAMFDSRFGEPDIANMNSSLNLTFCTFSHSRGGSVVILGTTSLAMESIHIANCSRGIESFKATITIKNLNVTNCTTSSMTAGHISMEGVVRIINSSLGLIECNTLFTGDQFESAMIVNQSSIYVTRNSVFQFKRFNGTFLGLFQSNLTLNRNSTIIFTQNSADGGIIDVYLFQSHMDMSNGSTLSITDNTLRDVSVMLMFNDSSMFVSHGILLFENNSCQYCDLMLAKNTTVIWENRTLFNSTKNAIQHLSFIFRLSIGFMELSLFWPSATTPSQV